MPQWLHDATALADLHRGACAWLNSIRGSMVDLARKGPRRPRPGWGAFCDEYGRQTTLWHFAVGADEFLEALRSAKTRPFLSGPGGEAALRSFLTMATSKDSKDRIAAARLFRRIGDALDPPRGRGQASKFESRRIAVLYRRHRLINNSRVKWLGSFLSPPPASWLPAFIVSGGVRVKMDDNDWGHLAAVECVAAGLDVSDHTVESHLRKARQTS